MQARRRADGTEPVDLMPGDYSKSPVSYRGRTFDAWWYCSPNGLLGRLLAPEDVELGVAAGRHEVEEHADGTISVLPSIKVEGWPLHGGDRAPGEPLLSWHGYIRRGVWEAL